MKRVARMAIVAIGLVGGPLQAQTTPPNAPVPLATPAIARPIADAGTAATCELHVFPAKIMTAVNDLGGAGYLFGGGVVGAAVGSSVHGGKRSSTEALLSELPSSTQIAAVKSISSLGSITGLRDPMIIEEPAVAEEELAERSKARLTSSPAQCYAELVIWSVMFDGVGGPNLQIVTYFRKYVPKAGKMAIHNEIQFGRLHVFPPRTSDQVTAAHAELTGVFSAVLERSLRIMTGSD